MRTRKSLFGSKPEPKSSVVNPSSQPPESTDPEISELEQRAQILKSMRDELYRNLFKQLPKVEKAMSEVFAGGVKGECLPADNFYAFFPEEYPIFFGGAFGDNVTYHNFRYDKERKENIRITRSVVWVCFACMDSFFELDFWSDWNSCSIFAVDLMQDGKPVWRWKKQMQE